MDHKDLREQEQLGLDLEVEARDRAATAVSLAPALLPAAVLAACGGGGGSSPTPTPTSPTPTPTAALPSAIQASRFLGQATMGATKAEIEKVRGAGYEAWLNEQFAMQRETTHFDWLVTSGYATAAYINNEAIFDASLWRQLITGKDQLRQRVGLALSEIIVVGIGGLTHSWRSFATAAYFDILLDNAFGNFRTLIEQISLNPAMGQFLTFLGNRKGNPANGSQPDENYARELMQLFTMGVQKLNSDGTVQTAGGAAQETYSQADVSGLARVFTGFILDGADNTTPERMRRPMVQQPNQHETGVKTFLGTTIPAGTDGNASLTAALDTIFAHPNVPPFISKQLIQRLVTSNPSPAYVARVAAVFRNNGSGARGDLKAVVRAILLDAEARNDGASAAASFGKLREPIVRLTGWARAFNANSPSNAWPIGDTSNPTNRLAQSPGRSPSVFNFFRPGYSPPNTALSQQSLVAPEFQIATEPSVVAYVNYMAGLVANGAGDLKADYSVIAALAGDAQALVDEVNLVLAAGQLGSATVATIKGAVESVAATATNGAANRVNIAILLTLASPEFIVQK